MKCKKSYSDSGTSESLLFLVTPKPTSSCSMYGELELNSPQPTWGKALTPVNETGLESSAELCSFDFLLQLMALEN